MTLPSEASDKVNNLIGPVRNSGQGAKKVQRVAQKPLKAEEKRSIIEIIILLITQLLVTLVKKFLEGFLATEVSRKLGIVLTSEQTLLISEKFLDWAIQYGILVFESNKMILTIIVVISTIILTRS